jgi:D-serine deaminase-like pyridoxal phosphate-dependent protein
MISDATAPIWENTAMPFPLTGYEIPDVNNLLTPALLIYRDYVRSNIEATLRMLGGDPNRWRPHIKTAKLESVVAAYVQAGIKQFKCSTTLELLTACRAGAKDVLFAMAATGKNADRVKQISADFPGVRVSVLIETEAQVRAWLNNGIGVFLDLNSGMNRTGLDASGVSAIMQLARTLGPSFRGLHWYDGHVSMADMDSRRLAAFDSYAHLSKLIDQMEAAGIAIGEVITSGTPAAPLGIEYPGFHNRHFIHRVSPGTVVYNDLSSLKQLPDFGYRPAALVVATVMSHPLSNVVTCDAGHKSVGVDSGVPNCAVLGHPELTPLKPSEEHLPLEVAAGNAAPEIGSKLYLLPKHICPTVNNFDFAVLIEDGQIAGVDPVSARGREHPLAATA